MRILTSLLLPWLLLAAAPALACDSVKLQSFIAKAQSLAPDVENDGIRLAACPSLRDEVVQWLAFAREMRGDHEGARKVPGIAAPPRADTKDANRQRVLTQAKTNQYQPLLQKVEEAALGYVDSAEAQLVLARALVRSGQFERSRQAFSAYFRLVAEDVPAETEFLYTYLWEGDWREAREKFRSVLARGDTKTSLREAAKRGEVVAQQMEAKAPRQESGSPMGGGRRALVEGQFANELSYFELRRKYRRVTGAVSYQGSVFLEAAHHRLSSLVMDDSATNATSFVVGKDVLLWDTWGLKGELGYFSPGDDHFYGEASSSLKLPLDLRVGAGFQRGPLALLLPMSREDRDVMRETVFATVGWSEYLDLRGELRRDDSYAAHEAYGVTGRLPLAKGNAPNDYLYAKFPASVEIHPKPSPFDNVDPRVTRVGFGFDFSRSIVGPWMLRASTEYQLIHVQLRGRGGQARRLGRMQVSGEWASSPLDNWEFYLKGLYSRAEEEEDFRLNDLLNFIAVGIRFNT